MQLVGARSGDNRNLTARRSTEFRRVRRGLDSELLHRIHGYQTVRSAHRTERSKCSSKTVAPGLNGGDTDSDVCADAVHHPIVRSGALAVHVELSVVVG